MLDKINVFEVITRKRKNGGPANESSICDWRV